MDIFSFLKKRKKNNNLIFGNIGENIAKNFLIHKGYTIITSNFRCKNGEIDIICKKKNKISFTEVKTRSSTQFGTPEEAVTSTKQKRISKTAKYFLLKNHFPENTDFQADVVAIILKDGQAPQIKHYENAFPLQQ